jgi:hypothetical protein
VIAAGSGTGTLVPKPSSGAAEKPSVPTTIGRDTAGLLLLRGDLLLDTPEGPLHETRAAVCGCGRSQAQSLCDGACGVNDHRPPGTRNEA